MAESSEFVQQIIDRYALHDAIQALGKQVSRSELTSVLMTVFKERAAGVTAKTLLSQLLSDRFVRPSSVPQHAFVHFDRIALDLLPGWESIELAPIAPLGSCSAIAPVAQSLIVATSRGQEVMSDCTNVLALIAAQRRRKRLAGGVVDTVRMCTSHRLTRTASPKDRMHSAHFRVFTLVSAGRDTGEMEFEIEALREHIRFYVALTRVLCRDLLEGLHVRILEYAPCGVDWSVAMNGSVDDVEFTTERVDRPHWDYYHPVQFKINVKVCGSEYDLIDGGFVSWTRQLLSDRKERMLISAIGTEILCKVLLSEHADHFAAL